jgi:hypothetical protein
MVGSVAATGVFRCSSRFIPFIIMGYRRRVLGRSSGWVSEEVLNFIPCELTSWGYMMELRVRLENALFYVQSAAWQLTPCMNDIPMNLQQSS